MVITLFANFEVVYNLIDLLLKSKYYIFFNPIPKICYKF